MEHLRVGGWSKDVFDNQLKIDLLRRPMWYGYLLGEHEIAVNAGGAIETMKRARGLFSISVYGSAEVEERIVMGNFEANVKCNQLYGEERQAIEVPFAESGLGEGQVIPLSNILFSSQ